MTTPTPPLPTSPGGTSNSGGNLTTPQVVSVANGATTSGVNILVPGTASTINIKMLGVNSPGANVISASNVGGSIARGATATVLLFGSGLSGTETISISGPDDITISGEKSVRATDGTPGVQFTIAVSNGAAVGARTVSLKQDSNASAFVGGIEVF